jgi:hypothetical protein
MGHGEMLLQLPHPRVNRGGFRELITPPRNRFELGLERHNPAREEPVQEGNRQIKLGHPNLRRA